MPKVLTAAQVTSYRANGYLYPNDALSPAEVARYREELRKTETRLGGSLMAIDRKYRGNLHFLCRWMDDLIRHPAILDVVEDLIGPDILLYTSRFFIKEPHSEGIAAWHQDSTYFGLRPFEHVTAWVALCNVTKEAGPVEFAVGSHIRGQLQQRSNVVKNSVNTAGQIITEWFDKSQTDCAILKPGQFSLHHTCVVHQSAPNRSDERRVGIALSYIPTRVRHIGSRKMPACLVRGKDEYGHFDLQPRPVEDFGAVETQRHDQTFKAYLESFYEQLQIVEKDLPAVAADAAVAMMN
ncbi:MAG TPA: phytanoyl-CoA dioxygenase family protein [Burkholderiales bacterium]|nr:phytanoyl-CoA dioxygenase family protein [Burkholderiales bacterium]